MKVTYIEHSGFAVEMEEHILVFDYYKGRIPAFDKTKKLLVFASHAHEDHFNREILEWENLYPHIEYVFPKDMKIRKEERRESMHFMKKRDHLELEEGRCEVQSLRSTDEGVAFLVRCEGRCIYHAGDLNWWHWEEESASYNRQMKGDYQKEIESLKGKTIDLAFVVLDPRQEEQYYWGFDWFMRHTETTCVFPMHMWDDYDVIKRFREREEAAEYREKIRQITAPGEVFYVEQEFVL